MNEKNNKPMKLRDYYYQLGYKMLKFNAYTHMANAVSMYYVEKEKQNLSEYRIYTNPSNVQLKMQLQFECLYKAINIIYTRVNELPKTTIAQFEKQLLKSDQIEIKFEEIYKVAEDYYTSLDKICDELKSVGKAIDIREKLAPELITLRSHLDSVSFTNDNHYFIWKLWFLTGILSANCLNATQTRYVEIIEIIVPCYEFIFNKIRSLCVDEADNITISPEDDFMHFDEVPNVDFNITIAK